MARRKWDYPERITRTWLFREKLPNIESEAEFDALLAELEDNRGWGGIGHIGWVLVGALPSHVLREMRENRRNGE